jgi:hypothetical protein
MMDHLKKQQFIRQKAIENQNDSQGARIYWSRHAIAEMIKDDLTRTEVEQALQQCEVIEDYSTGHRPLPDCLVLTYLPDKRPLHTVIAVDEIKDRIFVITIYLPSPERWHHDWRTRK